MKIKFYLGCIIQHKFFTYDTFSLSDGDTLNGSLFYVGRLRMLITKGESYDFKNLFKPLPFIPGDTKVRKFDKNYNFVYRKHLEKKYWRFYLRKKSNLGFEWQFGPYDKVLNNG